MIKTCEKVDELECAAAACSGGKFVHVQAKAKCVVRDLLDFYKMDSGDTAAAVVPEAKFTANYHRFIKGEGKWNEYLLKHGEWTEARTAAAKPLLQLLVDGQAAPAGAAAANATAAYAQATVIRAQLLDSFQQEYQKLMGEVEVDGKTRIAWAIVEFRSSMTAPLSNGDAHAAFDLLEEFVKERRSNAPVGLGSLFQSDTLVPALGWTWMDVEDALVQNLMLGFAICFPVAFVVLVLATGNVIVAFYAIMSIALIVASVLGAAKLYAGWSLGVAESIAGVIVIGFSVDYTVHLGHIYKEAVMYVQDTKEQKTQHALVVMGTTVIGGGLTTLSAGLILYCCTLTFFTKMASLLVRAKALPVCLCECAVYCVRAFVQATPPLPPQTHPPLPSVFVWCKRMHTNVHAYAGLDDCIFDVLLPCLLHEHVRGLWAHGRGGRFLHTVRAAQKGQENTVTPRARLCMRHALTCSCSRT